MAVPELSDLLCEAEKPRVRRAPLANQITFPIYREDQWNRLQSCLHRRGLIATTMRFNTITGVEIGFSSEEDAIEAKMAFDPR